MTSFTYEAVGGRVVFGLGMFGQLPGGLDALGGLEIAGSGTG